VPLVVTVHDAVPWTHPETLTPRGVRWHRRMAELVAARADLVVVPTRAVAAELGARLRFRRLEVVGEGVGEAVSRVPEDAERRSARLSVPPGGYLLSLATMEPRKGLDVLVEALASARAPDLPLLLVGQPGWGGVDPVAHAARLGLPEGRVRVLGRLSDPDLATVLARATVLVVPSRAEGFGLPVLEAMAMGTPVVVSDAPALVEVAGDAAAVSPVGEPEALAAALAAVVADPGARREMTDRGRARARDFSWSSAASRLVDLYGSLVS
jgi:glycosyltransferase involved in cell wall biosynthesis